MTSRKRRLTSDGTSGKSKRGKFTLEKCDKPDTSLSGVVLVTGAGDVGQLGLGPDILEKSRPALVKLDHEIVDICAGGMHTVCLTREGKVITFGCNDEGALGRVTEGKEDAEFEPAEVELPGKVTQISAGDSHTAALLEDGRVFAWGTFRDSHGVMGLTPSGNQRSPYEIIKEQKIMKIASGADHIVFLNSYGEVYTCGCAEQGQLGRTSERFSDRSYRRNGGVSGKEQLDELLLPGKIRLNPYSKLHFENIWASTYGSFCKVADRDQVYVFGLNNFHQIGLKNLAPQFTPTLSKEFSKYKWKLITGGQHHTIALDTDGRVYAIGRREYGRLGLGKDCEDATELKMVEELKEKAVVNVASGSATSFAVTSEGELYAWGMGTNGQLGTGEEDDCELPTLVKSKQLEGKKAVRCSSGGQHSVFLVVNTVNNNKGDAD
ncbi:unnamed protein product [Callosobruchus maculatus]|uniref:RCC1-like domain-containing protein n=1 Tax=Callosobruchus maculatus TaxID=64391 RepID=A0A653D6U5_CALMS|nr:unnamed protein product [Callosobruchus maculatus]